MRRRDRESEGAALTSPFFRDIGDNDRLFVNLEYSFWP